MQSMAEDDTLLNWSCPKPSLAKAPLKLGKKNDLNNFVLLSLTISPERRVSEDLWLKIDQIPTPTSEN